MTIRSLFLLALFLVVPAWAQPAAVVDAVQAPAFLDRDGRSAPLAVGTELKAGDAIRTGAGARARLKLAEGSVVRLGENAALNISDLQPQKEGIFRAALRVIQGAFRFTTDAVAKGRKRDVSITVGAVTAGIRGTDLWGKSEAGREIVCLIEGRIEVGAQGEKPVVMDKPRQFYRREQGRTQPVGLVSPEQLGQWAKETEI
jgi:hypothetical protein